MIFILTGVLTLGPYLAACCATGFHAVHMGGLLDGTRILAKRQAETISVPTQNTTHWTVADNLREMQVTDDAFNSKDLAHYNHAAGVKVYYQGGVTTGLADHLTDMRLLYSMFSDVSLQNHNYPLRFGEGDWTITLTKVSGKNDGTLPGSSDVDYIAPTYRDTDYNFMTIGRWEFGLLQEEYLFSDSVTMNRQLGLFPDLPRHDLPFIPFDPQGDVGSDDAAANKIHANASDMAFNAGSRNSTQLLYSTDLMVYGLSDEPMDLSQYLAYLSQTRQAFPDLRYRHQHIIAQGEWTATLGMLSGTQHGSWDLPMYLASAPIPPTNKSFNLLHYVISRWSNGVIVDMHVNFDVLGVLAALNIET